MQDKSVENIKSQLEQFESELHELLQKHGITHYACCIAYPLNTGNPIVLFNDEYESTKLAARMHRVMKEKIIQEIS